VIGMPIVGGRKMRASRAISAVAAVVALVAVTSIAQAMSLGSWSPAVNVESIPGTHEALNSSALDGCPFVAQRGDVLYFASGRAGGAGGVDIWYSLRGEDGAWGEPVNFAAVNSAADDLCPAAHRNGRTFLFVSARAGGCGGLDIYMSRLHETKGWSTPANLGCTINSAAGEASPSLTDTELYFSSTRAGGPGGSDIYVSAFDGASFGAPALASGLNTALDDSRPNVRRDGLEIFFDSNRAGGIGLIDIWTATRASTSDAWSSPTNLGASVNSAANDLRPSLSWDATTLYFGSNRAGGEGNQDLYATTRPKLVGSD
jgi:Tol biopolymer transport system component